MSFFLIFEMLIQDLNNAHTKRDGFMNVRVCDGYGKTREQKFEKIALKPQREKLRSDGSLDAKFKRIR